MFLLHQTHIPMLENNKTSVSQLHTNLVGSRIGKELVNIHHPHTQQHVQNLYKQAHIYTIFHTWLLLAIVAAEGVKRAIFKHKSTKQKLAEENTPQWKTNSLQHNIKIQPQVHASAGNANSSWLHAQGSKRTELRR